jgi:hypothetical protein
MTLRVACPAGHPVILAADKLGTDVACPHCLMTFRADTETALRPHARKEDKARRARDDEDDDDEKPPKKAKTKKDAIREGEPPVKPKKRRASTEDDDEDEEDEKPRKKKSAAKKADDDEDDEDDEEGDAEDEEEEEEEPIEWTPRKRQLQRCGIGLTIMMVAYCILMGFSFFIMLLLVYYTFEIMNYIGANSKMEGIPLGEASVWLGLTAAPFLALAQVVLLVALVMSLFSVPAKVEAKGALIAGIVFGGLVFLAGTLILLAHYEVIVSDVVRSARLIQLMGGGAGLCFFLSTLSAMAYHGKLLHFLNLRLEASQPITNTLFYFLYFIGAFIIFLATPYVCYYLFVYFGWAVILGICAVIAIAIRQLIAQAKMFLLAKKAIDKYIREA